MIWRCYTADSFPITYFTFYLVVLLDELGGLLSLQLSECDLLEGRLLALLALRRQREIG